MSATLVLRDKIIDLDLPMPLPSDLPTLLHCRAIAAGGEACALALLALDEAIAPVLRKKLRSSARKIPLSLVQEALQWHVQRTVEVIAGWGPEGPLASPLWEVDTMLRFDRFVARMWHPHSPRIAARWATRHRDAEFMPSDVRLQTFAMWRGGGFHAPPIDGWEVIAPAPFMSRPRLARSGPEVQP